MNNARENILQRLNTNTSANRNEVPLFVPGYQWTKEQKIENFSRHIQAVHAEVHRTAKSHWLDTLLTILKQKSLNRILMSTETKLGKEVQGISEEYIQFLEYILVFEEWKDKFFSDIQAGITTTKGAIAETGSLILWPTIEEPRLISLIPPIHIAILDADCIYDTFAQVIQKQKWANAMPSNALLISGPSKTADIEQVLAYGVHGPKQLIVILRE